MTSEKRVVKNFDDIIIHNKSCLYPLDYKIKRIVTIGSKFFPIKKNDVIEEQKLVCYYI